MARDGAKEALIDVCRDVQKFRNDIIHKGMCQVGDTDHAVEVAAAVFGQIVIPMLGVLGLSLGEKGRIEQMPSL